MARKLHFGPARVPSRESPEAAVASAPRAEPLGLRDRFRGRLLDELRVRRAVRRARARGRRRAFRPCAPCGLHGPCRTGEEAEHGGRDAGPLGRDRQGRGRRGRRLPPGVPARPDARGGDRLGLRAARRAPRAARRERTRRAVRDRGDGPGSRARVGRRRRRDLPPASLGAPGARLRPYARDLGRRVHLGRAVRGGAREGGRGARSRRAVPHPLLGHPVREPERDEASPLRRRNAPRRAAGRGARAVRAARRR